MTVSRMLAKLQAHNDSIAALKALDFGLRRTSSLMLSVVSGCAETCMVAVTAKAYW